MRRALACLTMAAVAAGWAPSQAQDLMQESDGGAVVDRVLRDSRLSAVSGFTLLDTDLVGEGASGGADGPILAAVNDGPDSEPLVYGVDRSGWVTSVVRLRGVGVHDWEDVASGPQGSVWIGDIGDNTERRTAIDLYVVDSLPDALLDGPRTVTPRAITLSYPDGPHDAEALLVHPVTGRVLVATRDAVSGTLYEAPAELSSHHANVLDRVGDVPAGVSGGAFSASGARFVLATHSQVLVYEAPNTEPTSVVDTGDWNTGESITFLDEETLLLGSEGVGRPVYRLSIPSMAPPPVTGEPRLGVYNGPAGQRPDETSTREFGAPPEVANSYYQSHQSVDLDYERGRIERGTSPNLTITTKGTQLISGIARGEPTALAWLRRYVEDVGVLSRLDPTVPVYATLEHEYRAKVRQGLVTGDSARPEVYGRALTAFYAMVAEESPAVRTTYWFVGSDRDFEGAVGEALDVNPRAVVFDPYAHDSNDTLTTITAADLAWLRTQPWYVGQEIGLGEFGMPVSQGDAALSAFYTGIRQSLAGQGIPWAVLFNRTRDNNHKITTGAFPRAVAAFSTSLRQHQAP